MVRRRLCASAPFDRAALVAAILALAFTAAPAAAQSTGPDSGLTSPGAWYDVVDPNKTAPEAQNGKRARRSYVPVVPNRAHSKGRWFNGQPAQSTYPYTHPRDIYERKRGASTEPNYRFFDPGWDDMPDELREPPVSNRRR